MDSRTVDTRGAAGPNKVLEVLGVIGAVVIAYLALSAVLEATTAIDVPFINWSF